MPGSFASAEMKPPKPKGRPHKMGDTAQQRPLLTAPPLKPREWHKVKVKRTEGDDSGRAEAKRRQVSHLHLEGSSKLPVRDIRGTLAEC